MQKLRQELLCKLVYHILVYPLRLELAANCVALYLLGELLQHIDLSLPSLALLESRHDLFGPFAALSARRALTTGLVPVEVAQPRDSANNISALIHDNNSRCAETRLAVLQGIKVHELVVANAFG